MDFRAALQKKYDIMQQQADAQTANSRSENAFRDIQAGMLPQSLRAQIAAQLAQARLTGVQADAFPESARSENKYRDAQRLTLDEARPLIQPMGRANIAGVKANTAQTLEQTRLMGPESLARRALMGAQTRGAWADAGSRFLGNQLLAQPGEDYANVPLGQGMDPRYFGSPSFSMSPTMAGPKVIEGYKKPLSSQFNMFQMPF